MSNCETLWKNPTGAFRGRPFPSSGVELKAWCRESYELVLKGGREACVVISEHEKHIEPGNATITQLNIAAAIRRRGEGK